MAPSGTLPNVCRVCSRRIAQPGNQWRGFSSTRKRNAEDSALPRVANPSIWASMIPKAFRRPAGPISAATQSTKQSWWSKEWNPATFYIWMGLLVGSNAIQMIALRNDTANFSRKADARLSVLREVIQRVKNGEDVDVEGLLGTGDPVQEKEWEEVMKEVEEEDTLWEQRKKRLAREQARRTAMEEKTRAADIDAAPQSAALREGGDGDTGRRPKFLM